MKLQIPNLTSALSKTAAAVSVFLLTAQVSFAQISNPVIGEDLGTIESSSCEAGNIFVQYFIMLWNAVISIGAILVLVMFIWGAFEWLSADGEASKVAKARGRIINAALGMLLLVALSAWFSSERSLTYSASHYRPL